jgi:hypothetical protein
MEPIESYEELATSFPAMWPQFPDWTWVDVHDGRELKVDILSEMVESTLGSAEVILLVHSEPGVALRIPTRNVAEHVAQFILKHDVQLSDPQFNHFLSISAHGLATADA